MGNLADLVPPSDTTRGSLIILDGTFEGAALVFPINPETFEEDDNASYTHHAIIGRSHPLSQFEHGDSRPLRFTLHLDAKNELLANDFVGVVVPPGLEAPLQLGTVTRWPGGNAVPERRPIADKVREIVGFLQMLTLPRLFESDRLVSGAIAYGPPPVLFDWGPFHIRCIVISAKTEWLEFTPDLDPLRAKVEMELHQQPVETLSLEEHWETKGDTGGGVHGAYQIPVDPVPVPEARQSPFFYGIGSYFFGGQWWR